MMWQAQKVPPGMAVSRTYSVALVMVFLVVSSMTYGMGEAIGTSTTMLVSITDRVSVRMVVTVMLLAVKVGPERKHLGMLSELMQANFLTASTKVNLVHRKQGSLLQWLRRNSYFRPELALVKVQLGLGLEEWTEALTRGDDVKPSKEVVVCQGNDALGCREHLAEESALLGGIFSIAFEKHDEKSVGPLVGRRGSMPGGGGW